MRARKHPCCDHADQSATSVLVAEEGLADEDGQDAQAGRNEAVEPLAAAGELKLDRSQRLADTRQQSGRRTMPCTSFTDADVLQQASASLSTDGKRVVGEEMCRDGDDNRLGVLARGGRKDKVSV